MALPSARKLQAQIADALTCPICFRPYDLEIRLPKVFPCQHTVCRQCASELHQRDGNVFPCPSCQRPVTVPAEGASGLQTNLDVRNMAEIMERDMKEPVCPKHPASFVTNVCMRCEVGICPKCIASSVMHDHSDHMSEVLETGDAFKALKEICDRLDKQGRGIKRSLREKDSAIERLIKAVYGDCVSRNLRVFKEIGVLSSVLNSSEFTDPIYTMNAGLGEGDFVDRKCGATERKHASACIQDGRSALENYSKALHETTKCTKLSAVAIQTDLLRLKLSCNEHDYLAHIVTNLWHLLDESLPCCHRVVMLGGVDLLISCFSHIDTDLRLLRPLLEVFGNISEHLILHKHILTPTVVTHLVSVLHKFSMNDDQIPERSCRILSHFLSNRSVTWPLDCPTRDGTSQLVIDTCKEFGLLRTFTIVSFHSHLRLMSQQVSQAAKYWAIWWLDQCTLKHPKRYSKILLEQGAVSVLENQAHSDEYVREKCNEVLQRIQAFPVTSSACLIM